MKIIPTNINDLFIIEPEVFKDDRGWFTESYNKKRLAEAGIEVDFVQNNHSFTKTKELFVDYISKKILMLSLNL